MKLWAYILFAAVLSGGVDSALRSQAHDIIQKVSVTDYTDTFKASSALSCVADCMQRTACDSFAYNEASGECYMQAKIMQQTEDVDSGSNITGYVTVPSDGQCTRSDAVNRTTTVAWHPSGQQGDIICNGDYMYSGDSPIIVCKTSAQWSADGVCKQRIWRNLQGDAVCELPRPISPGWAMCVQGTTCTGCVRFSLNLQDDAAINTPLHADIRIRPNRFLLDTKVNGRWLYNQIVLDMPSAFKEGQPFEVEFRLLSTTEVQIFVNGTEFYNYSAPIAITGASVFAFTTNGGNASVEVLDIWSGC